MLHPMMLLDLSRQRQDAARTRGRQQRRRNVHPGQPSAAIVALQPLMHTAAELDVSDGPGWERLRTEADPVLTALVDRGSLPERLRLDAQQPPACVAAVLTAAWVHVTGPAQVRHHRR